MTFPPLHLRKETKQLNNQASNVGRKTYYKHEM